MVIAQPDALARKAFEFICDVDGLRVAPVSPCFVAK
jgi:hypothetical protein